MYIYILLVMRYVKVCICILSMPLKQEGGVLTSFILGRLCALVLASTWHMCEHLFVFLSEVWREVRLLGLSFDFAPLGILHGFRGVI